MSIPNAKLIAEQTKKSKEKKLKDEKDLIERKKTLQAESDEVLLSFLPMMMKLISDFLETKNIIQISNINHQGMYLLSLTGLDICYSPEKSVPFMERQIETLIEQETARFPNSLVKISTSEIMEMFPRKKISADYIIGEFSIFFSRGDFLDKTIRAISNGNLSSKKPAFKSIENEIKKDELDDFDEKPRTLPLFPYIGRLDGKYPVKLPDENLYFPTGIKPKIWPFDLVKLEIVIKREIEKKAKRGLNDCEFPIIKLKEKEYFLDYFKYQLMEKGFKVKEDGNYLVINWVF